MAEAMRALTDRTAALLSFSERLNWKQSVLEGKNGAEEDIGHRVKVT